MAASTQVAGLDIELRAKTAHFDREMRSAVQRAKRYAGEAKNAKAANDNFAGSFSSAANSVAILDGPLGGVAGRLSAIAAGLKMIGPLGVAAGTAIAASTTMLGRGMAVYEQTQRQQQRTEALLRATGDAAGFTAGELDTMARSVAMATLASTEGIRDAQAVMLTFRSVSGDTFERAIGLAQDLAYVINGDARSAAMMLGKALEDPTKGITAMTKAGVSFTSAEKDKIKTLAESNRLLEAQEMILDKLSGQVGGAGGGDGIAFDIDTLGQLWDEFNENLFETSGAAAATEAALESLAGVVATMSRGLKPDDRTVLEHLKAEREAIKKAMTDAGDPSGLSSLPVPFMYDKNDWYNDQRRLQAINEQILAIQDRRVEELKAINDARKAGELAQQRIKDEQELARQIERQAKAEADALKSAEARAKAKDSLYTKIFGEEDGKKKPFVTNSHFEIEARATRNLVRGGNVTMDDATRMISRLDTIATGLAKNADVNYDVQGMRDVVELLRAEARDRFGRSEFDKAIEERKGRPASLEFEGLGESIKMQAESSQTLATAVDEWVTESAKRAEADSEFNKEFQQLMKEQQELAQNPPEQKPTKFELTLKIGDSIKVLRGESGDHIVDQLSLERAATAAE